jgi:chromate transporter
MKTKFLAAIGIGGVILIFLGLHELLVLLGGGLIVVVARLIGRSIKGQQNLRSLISASPLILFLQAGTTGVATASFSLALSFLFFLKVGAVLYGSGYVLLAFIRADLVERWHWLTESQLLDAVAVGQVTPGPVFTTATFIGYVLGGTKGAAVATAGIFLPAFVFVAASGPVIPRLRRSPTAGAFLDGVNAAALALMVVVTYQLGRAAIIDFTTIALAIISGVLLFSFRLNSAWLVLGGAIAGWLLYGRVNS